jgi:hypothetical protein
MTPELELAMTLRVEIAGSLDIGEVGAGLRRVIPITGGSFEGPAIRGVVLPGGADWPRFGRATPCKPMIVCW